MEGMVRGPWLLCKLMEGGWGSLDYLSFRTWKFLFHNQI